MEIKSYQVSRGLMDTSSWGTEEAHVLMSSVVLKDIYM